MLFGGLHFPKSISQQSFMQKLEANRENNVQLENREYPQVLRWSCLLSVKRKHLKQEENSDQEKARRSSLNQYICCVIIEGNQWQV